MIKPYTHPLGFFKGISIFPLLFAFYQISAAQHSQTSDQEYVSKIFIPEYIEKFLESRDLTIKDTVKNVPVTEKRTEIPIISYFYEPYPLEIGASVFQIGASASMLPLPIAEQEFPYPMVDVQYKRGLMKNISFVASFSTIAILNLFHSGLQWNINSGRFSFGLANHVGGAFGIMPEDVNFDKVMGWSTFDMAIVRFGYRFDDFSLSTSFVTTYVFESSSRVNYITSSLGPKNTLNDFFCTIAVEQPFLKNAHISVGFSLGFAKTPYQSWMSYNTLEQWFFVPEFFFSVQL